jgi:type II secretory pathway pseudopilin PulG
VSAGIRHRGGTGHGAEAGFSLVALVATMTIMLILMGTAMPSWKYVMKNEREQELYFRGDQIASAIERYQKKNAGTAPPSLEVLVKGRYLRKAYADPMTKDGTWRFIRVGEVMLPRAGGSLPGRPAASPTPSPTPSPSRRPGMGAQQLGPFIGVASTSKEESLRVMNGHDHYDQWLFVAGRPRILGRDGPQIPGGNAMPGQKPGSGAPGLPKPGQTVPGQTK